MTVADTTVQLLVVVLANTSQVERNTIFSYFYQTLRKQPLKSINAAHEYEDVLSLLGGHIDQ
ncbi:hypothetical protein [Lacticaseibacillus saniviri]|uniref:hypothetical protein n=1 Tax=Lacticaseibacillus saniviri TaxID=931533 RepID=UPI0006CF4A15|nr:hypothetical protein [Lacticaseibacillus saniviri]